MKDNAEPRDRDRMLNALQQTTPEQHKAIIGAAHDLALCATSMRTLAVDIHQAKEISVEGGKHIVNRISNYEAILTDAKLKLKLAGLVPDSVLIER